MTVPFYQNVSVVAEALSDGETSCILKTDPSGFPWEAAIGAAAAGMCAVGWGVSEFE